jgi:ribosome-associated protein
MSKKLLNCIINSIDDVKGKDIVVINLKKINNSICDFFIICHGDSTTQVNAIAESVVKKTREIEERTFHKEGFDNSQWILLDYHTIIVHVFLGEIRAFYDIESLWADAEVQPIDDLK